MEARDEGISVLDIVPSWKKKKKKKNKKTACVMLE